VPSEPVYPVDIELDRQRALRIAWSDGRRDELGLSKLRQACPCATCRGTHEPAVSGALPIVQSAAAQQLQATAERIDPVGRYALRIRWADGHDVGIYEYAFLRHLADAHEPEALAE
jgi:DUF971 family protein